LRSKYLDSGKYKIITIKNVQDGSVDSIRANCLDILPTGINPACILTFGDILISLTGNVTEEDLLLNQRVAKFNSLIRKILPFWYFLFRQSEMKDHLISIAKGTAQQNLSPTETLETKIAFDENLVIDYSEIVAPMFWVIAENQKESTRLAILRDTLLPRLMSGELSVSS
jgi:type I restriction enzyme S subunit